jgi:biotin carboxylase
LIPWNVDIAAHYGLSGAGAGLNVLASKILVREHMRTLGLSTIRFSGDPAEVDFFPAIVKPTRVSSASWLVRRVDSPAELLAYQHHLAEIGAADTELIIEEYLPGTEFSVDGPVVGGRFHSVLAVEKPDHDNIRHHDSGLLVHPPQLDHVREGVRVLSETINTLCADLRLDQLWLHFEGRSAEDGRTELIEINPRPGGGTHPAVIREASGIDPFEAFISMSLGEFTFTPDRPEPVRDWSIVGMVDLEAFELGTVEITTTADDLRALPGVITVKMIDGFQISSLDKENSFLGFAVTGESMSQLRARAATVLDNFVYRVTAT